MDNATTVHYVNIRFGRQPHLAALVGRLEKAERRALCWATACHIKGVENVVADLGSRQPSFPEVWAGDRFAHAVAKKSVVLGAQSRLRTVFEMDLFCDREGREAVAPSWRSPENSAFEAEIHGKVVWCHPPPSLLHATFKWLELRFKGPERFMVAVLAPEDKQAPWFRAKTLQNYKRTQRWDAGADLLRWIDCKSPPAGSGEPRWRKGHRTALPYVLLTRSSLDDPVATGAAQPHAH